MKFYLSVICAILGIGLALFDSAAGIKTIVDAALAIPQQIKVDGVGDPSKLSAIIGEAIIAYVSRGVFAFIPAILIYLALGPLRLRQNWFHQWARIAGWCLVILLPFGSICGCILLVLIRRRKSEFSGNVHLAAAA